MEGADRTPELTVPLLWGRLSVPLGRRRLPIAVRRRRLAVPLGRRRLPIPVRCRRLTVPLLWRGLTVPLRRLTVPLLWGGLSVPLRRGRLSVPLRRRRLPIAALQHRAAGLTGAATDRGCRAGGEAPSPLAQLIHRWVGRLQVVPLAVAIAAHHLWVRLGHLGEASF